MPHWSPKSERSWDLDKKLTDFGLHALKNLYCWIVCLFTYLFVCLFVCLLLSSISCFLISAETLVPNFKRCFHFNRIWFMANWGWQYWIASNNVFRTAFLPQSQSHLNQFNRPLVIQSKIVAKSLLKSHPMLQRNVDVKRLWLWLAHPSMSFGACGPKSCNGTADGQQLENSGRLLQLFGQGIGVVGEIEWQRPEN